MTHRSWSGVARYGLPGLLLGGAIVLAFGGGGGNRLVWAQGPNAVVGDRAKLANSVGDGTGTLAFTSQTAGSAQLLYLIDTRARAFAVYRIDPSNSKGTIKLEGVRQYPWDLKLDEYNNLPPEVAAIEGMTKNRVRSTH